jgi:hypothetical protein
MLQLVIDDELQYKRKKKATSFTSVSIAKIQGFYKSKKYFLAHVIIAINGPGGQLL